MTWSMRSKYFGSCHQSALFKMLNSRIFAFLWWHQKCAEYCMHWFRLLQLTIIDYVVLFSIFLLINDARIKNAAYFSIFFMCLLFASFWTGNNATSVGIVCNLKCKPNIIIGTNAYLKCVCLKENIYICQKYDRHFGLRFGKIRIEYDE